MVFWSALLASPQPGIYEQPDGRQCLFVSAIESTTAFEDHIDYRLRDGRAFRNDLEAHCEDLGPGVRIVPGLSNLTCQGYAVLAFNARGNQVARGCRLGGFRELAD